LWYFRSRDQGQKERWTSGVRYDADDDLRISRRGKHHNLVSGILKQLDGLAKGSALIVPLDSIGEMSFPVCALR